MKTHEELLTMWRNVNHVPGWLRLLGNSKELDEKDIEELEQIDEDAIAVQKEAEENSGRFNANKMEDIREFREEVEKEIGSEEMKDMFLRGLKDKKRFYEKQLKEIEDNYQDSVAKDKPTFLRLAVKEINNPRDLEKKIQKLAFDILLIENPEEWKGIDRVSPAEIKQAQDFPFDQIVEFDKRGFALCPFHDEKNASFHYYKKTNRGYCFSCQWSGNVIDFVRQTKDLSFKEAVRFLIA